MLIKTKAAMPGRQCYYTKLVRSQDSTLIDQVNGLNHSESDGLSWRACLRSRRLISPCMAVTMNCPVLSPGSFTFSIASTTSCGARACTFCDLLFTWSLSISGFLSNNWNPVYTKKEKEKGLNWNPLDAYTGFQLSVAAFNYSEALEDCSPSRASNHNVRWSNDHG